MKKATSTILGALAGTTIGALVSPIVTVSNMACDAVAPISYPIVGAISGVVAGASVYQSSEDKLLSAAAGIGYFIGTVALIPTAPLLMASRPITTPLFHTIGGGVIGGVTGYMCNKTKKEKMVEETDALLAALKSISDNDVD
jgi:outer membrane lipoprotein SlyB